MRRLKLILILLSLLSFGNLFANETEQDFSQTKIGWDGPPEYEFKLVECKRQKYPSRVYVKLMVKHPFANQKLNIYSVKAIDYQENEYEFGWYKHVNYSISGEPYFYGYNTIVAKTDQETMIEVCSNIQSKVDVFDTFTIAFKIEEPFYHSRYCLLKFLDLPVIW